MTCQPRSRHSGFMHHPYWKSAREVEQYFRPSVNVAETSEAYEIELIAPGRTKTDFTLHIDKGVLTIEVGQPVVETESTERSYTRREFELKKAKRVFELPDNVDVDQISAKYVEGILTVRLPKIQGSPVVAAKQIAID